MRDLATELYPSELAAVAQLVEEELGTIWGILSEAEQHHLALGRRSISDELLHRFAGLSLGLAVETSLSEFLFNRLRDLVRDQQLPELQVTDANDYLEPLVADFFNCKRNYLMLGQMVGAFNRAAHSDTPATRPADRLIAAYLGELPGAQDLLAADKATRTIRRKALNRINEIRVNCAHPKQPHSKEDLDWLWDHVVSDRQHAFFRYFRGAFISDN